MSPKSTFPVNRNKTKKQEEKEQIPIHMIGNGEAARLCRSAVLVSKREITWGWSREY